MDNFEDSDASEEDAWDESDDQDSIYNAEWIDAVSDEDYESVRTYLLEGEDINKPIFELGGNALHACVRQGLPA